MDDIEQIDFDNLNPLERDYYLKALETVQNSQITLDDFKVYIKGMLKAVAKSLADEPLFIYSAHLPFLKRQNPNIVQLQARLKTYLIFESFFDRPDQAKAQLDLYKKRLKIK